jgi:hypothetical protein
VPVASGRLFQLPLLFQHIAQVDVGLGEVGAQLEGEPVTGGRLLQPAQVLKGAAQVAVGLDVVGPVPQGLPDVLHRLVAVAQLKGDDTEQVQGVGVLGVGLEDLQVDGPSPQQVAGPVELHGPLEGDRLAELAVFSRHQHPPGPRP